MLTIARQTFSDAIRQPLYLVVLAGALGWIALSPVLMVFTFGSAARLLVDRAIGTLLVGGVVLAAYLPSRTIAREIERGVASMTLVRAIGRGAYLAGKLLGVAAAVATAGVVWTGAMIATVRGPIAGQGADPVAAGLVGGVVLLAAGAGVLASCRGRSARAAVVLALLAGMPLVVLALSAIAPDGRVQSLAADWSRAGLSRAVLASLLVVESSLAFSAVGAVLATRVGETATVVGTLAMVAIAAGSDALLGSDAARGPVARAGSWIVPRLGDPLHAGEGGSGLAHAARVTASTALYASGLLLLGIALLRNRRLRP